MSIKAGVYKGRGIAGSEQYGISENGNDQIAIDLDLGEMGRASTILNFSDAAAPYAVQRLRACGWKGNDLTRLDGIDANEVDVQVKYEEYKGEQKMRVEIMTGGGRVKFKQEMDDRAKRAFAARMKPLLGGAAPAPKPATSRGFGPTSSAEDDIPF